MTLFAKNPHNTLKSIVFTDGVIEGFTRRDQEVFLTLRDYCGSLIKISFIGVLRMLAHEHIVGTEVMKASFHWTGDNWVVNFKNDDSETIFEISYENAVLNKDE